MKTTFNYLITSFITNYLGAEQGLSRHTIASYSDCLKLLIRHTGQRQNTRIEKLDVHDITRERVIEFLDILEQERKNAPSSRNQRLAAIKTFFRFAATQDPELMLANERIQAIKLKRVSSQPPPSLTREEVAALLKAPDQETFIGVRDAALLQLLYNTGARVQEIADLTLTNLRLDTACSVTVTGKRRKTRIIPIWPETVALINRYLEARKHHGIESEYLFLNHKGKPLTRFGIGRRVALYAQKAADQCPSLAGRHITPHTFRHTTALHLVEAGNDITVVRDWLGHSDIRTTSVYLEVSIERKRQALEKLPPPTGNSPPQPPQWKEPQIMDFLNQCARSVYYVASSLPAIPSSP